MNLSCINYKQLLKEKQAIEDYIKKRIDYWLDYFEKHSFKEKQKQIWDDKIKDFFIFENLDYEGLEKKDEKILELLEREDLEYKYLDLGECSEGWYFGFVLDGKEAIVTSSGKIFRNTLQKTKDGIFGENKIKELFDYEGYTGEIAPTISKETIKKHYLKKQRSYLINPKEIYKAVKDKILYYMDFSGKNEIADVLTCWVIATYCYPLFYWFPHILINAPSQSGKSKCAYLLIELSFRGFDLGASGGVSPPQIFRTLEGNRGTILLDEFEQSNNKNNQETQQLVNQILNASASKDAYVIRTEQINRKWVAKKFYIFSPKITCNISGINPTSLSRFIAFSWLKTNSEKGQRKPQKPDDKKSFISIRKDLYLFILEKWREIKEIYNSLEINLSNRDEDNWLPLYAIARFIDGFEGEEINVEEQLNKYIEDYKDLQIETNDNTEDFFRILCERVSEEERYYTPKEIGGWSEITDLFSYLKSPAHKIGSLLKQYKFKDNHRAGGIKKYLLSKNSVKIIINLYFDTNKITPNNTIDTEQHKQHKITQVNENVSLCGISVITSRENIFEKLGILNERNEWINSLIHNEEEEIPIIKIGNSQNQNENTN